MKGLSFNEQKEYNGLEKEIAQLEEQKASIEAAFAEGTLSNDEIQTQSIALQQTLTAIEEKTERWFVVNKAQVLKAHDFEEKNICHLLVSSTNVQFGYS